MILEKRPILLVLVLHFLRALCDDDALTSKGTTIAVSATLDYDFEWTGNPGTIYEGIYGSTESHFASRGATTTFHGSTVEPLATDSQPIADGDESSSSTTADQTESFTMTNDVTSTSTIDTTCSATWPINASSNENDPVDIRNNYLRGDSL